MTAAAGGITLTPEAAALVAAAADDLELLARLHDREPDREVLEALRRVPFRDQLGLSLAGEAAHEALAMLERGLAGLPAEIDREVLDELAAEYAAIYVTHQYRAGCSESVWLGDEHLERQEPMFEVRKWYRRYGLEVRDWQRRPDDHIVPQLQFLARLLRPGTPGSLRDAARFADRHILRWIGDFAEAVDRRARTWYFAGLARLTHAYLEELRDLLEHLTGERRWTPPARAGRPRREEEFTPYLPGMGPGW